MRTKETRIDNMKNQILTAIEHNDKSVNMIVVDGEPMRSIRIMLRHYNTYNKAHTLFAHTQITRLEETIERSVRGVSYDMHPGRMTNFHRKAIEEGKDDLLKFRFSQSIAGWHIWADPYWVPAGFILADKGDR